MTVVLSVLLRRHRHGCRAFLRRHQSPVMARLRHHLQAREEALARGAATRQATPALFEPARVRAVVEIAHNPLAKVGAARRVRVAVTAVALRQAIRLGVGVAIPRGERGTVKTASDR